ncbi:MAG: FAD-dependent oxidoreductase, partial [Gammaproteobacteria bacterium]
GGRIFDVSLDGKDTSPRIGVGARRILDKHSLLTLGNELGISFGSAPNHGDLILARGKHAETKDELAKLGYPSLAYLDKSQQRGDEVEAALVAQLKNKFKQRQLPDFPSFVKEAVGSEGYRYLLDVSRFRGDFQYPIDTASYLDWLQEESKYDDSEMVYPQGGMSELIKRMAEAARKKGVRFFMSQPVKSLNRVHSGFVALTPNYRISARKIMIAVNAAHLESIRGDVIDAVVGSPQYRQLLDIPVVTVTQWWPNPWWKKANYGKEISRVWTTDHCINLMEIPTDEYGSRQLVTRTVYADEMACVAQWRQLIAVSIQAVETEISRELNEIFPAIEIPKPLKTFVQVWPDAWYWLKAGSPYSNCDIADWAVKPLPGEPVFLVGDSYNPQRSTWSEGAVSSSNAALNALLGLHLPNSATDLFCESTLSDTPSHRID